MKGYIAAGEKQIDMKCPNCNETLLMTERHNVEIDYCPACRGVWLDKGELDKMLEYVENKYTTGDRPMQQPPAGEQYGNYSRDDNDDYKQHKHGKPYRKKGFLGDLFDFD